MENGQYKNGEIPKTRHPNILRSVMIGKKSWGLWVDQWSDGIVECSFTLEEILEEFSSKNITIPDSFLVDFKNRIRKKKEIKFQEENYRIMKERENELQKEIERLQSGGMWV